MKRIYLIIVTCLALFSCSKEDRKINKASNEQNILSIETMSNQDKQMQLFAKSLSKAVYSNKDVRSFIKEQALQKVDNDYDVFYPFVMDKMIGEKTFKEIILHYGENRDILSSISKNIPLLNIYLPEYGPIKVNSIDIDNEELPVLFKDKLYLNGEIVHTLSSGEIPGFHTLVVCQNNKLQKKTFTRTTGSEKDSYEFVAKCFNPAYNKPTTKTSIDEYDEYNEKYDPQKGLVPENNIDPELIKAYRNTMQQKRGTRYVMYHGLNKIEDTPKSLRTDIADCIFRFKISSSAFSRLNYIATGDNKPLFLEKVEHKKTPLSREDVLNSIMTGRAFCFVFQIQDNIKCDNPESQRIKIYAKPDMLFNLKIDETRRHPTMFRRTKYTYTIDFNQIKSKWFYPIDNDQDPRFDRWDITTDPVDKIVTVYLINPDDGLTKEITEEYSVTYLTNAGAGFDFKILPKLVNIGILGNFSSNNTISKKVTSPYKITEENELIDKFRFNYFNDYPIEEVLPNGYIIPIRKGRGIIETSILPISNKFYTQGIR